MFYDKIEIQFGGKSMIENIEGTTINIRIQDEEIALPNEIKRKIEESTESRRPTARQWSRLTAPRSVKRRNTD